MHHNACIILVGHSLWYVNTNPTVFLFTLLKEKMAIYCPQGSGTLRQQLLSMHGIAWYCMVLHGIAWYCMALLGIAWYCMDLHGIPW